MNLSAQRQRLVQMLHDYTQTGPAEEDSKKSLRDYHHELSVFDNHPADVATEDFLRNLDAAIRENDTHLVELIQKAIARIDRGDYEYCTGCGRKIAGERLEALPYADSCSECAEKRNELGGLGKPSTFPGFPEDPTWPKFNQYGTSDSIQDRPNQVRDRGGPK